jgi:hypothetical protein
MAPPNALNVVINEFVHEEALAVVKLRQHRCPLDHDGLNGENSQKDKYDEDQKNVASKPQPLDPKALTGIAPKVHDIDVAIVLRRYVTEINARLLSIVEHRISTTMQRAAIPYAALIQYKR